MDVETVNLLHHLNRQFYQTFASQFSATRQRIQPGIRIILEKIPKRGNFLDLGCGNGEFARALLSNHQYGTYLGLDFSPEMVAIAKQRASRDDQDWKAEFIVTDLLAPNWAISFGSPTTFPSFFDSIFAFAVFHHIPGEKARISLLSEVRKLLSSNGCLVFSVWQFLHNPKLSGRILPWETIGLSSDRVDPNDYLLDWRSGGLGFRYVHHFSATELEQLANIAGFTVADSFYADGHSGDLALYQTWFKP
jgi:SAM-dependent methyltransferase